jgi:hypothetical protein
MDCCEKAANGAQRPCCAHHAQEAKPKS